MINIGIVTTRVALAAVLLEDGEYVSHLNIQFDPHKGRSTWDRNYHMNMIADQLYTWVDTINDTYKKVDSIAVLSANYNTDNFRNLVESAQTVGVVLAMPYPVYEVSKSRAEEARVQEVNGLPDDIKERSHYRDAYRLARYTYQRQSEQDSNARLASSR